MLADAAKSVYDKYKVYVPVELALSQLAQEGGFTSKANSRPIRTKNPFNVGNVDSGKNAFHGDVQSGINRYYDLMAKSYLGNNKSLDDLLTNFVNKAGNRYATDKQYEQKLKGIVDGIRRNSDQVYAAAAKSNTSDIA
jgi:flagellum-specific peptidoglycan hydrolase FlgJ